MDNKTELLGKSDNQKDSDESEKLKWQKQRRSLKEDAARKNYSYNPDWQSAINIFRDRIEKKFITPLKLLKDYGDNDGVGFSIVAIECLLIETFAAFRSGKYFNHSYSEKNGIPYQYGDSKSLFVEFLTTVAPFNAQFSPLKQKEIDNKSNLFSAPEFYTDVRCGLLHEGKTKKDWTINLRPKEEQKGIFLGRNKNQLKIYRTVFLTKLEAYIKFYVETELVDNCEKADEFRRNFARKMDHLYEFNTSKQKNGYEWWEYEKNTQQTWGDLFQEIIDSICFWNK